MLCMESEDLMIDLPGFGLAFGQSLFKSSIFLIWNKDIGTTSVLPLHIWGL